MPGFLIVLLLLSCDAYIHKLGYVNFWHSNFVLILGFGLPCTPPHCIIAFNHEAILHNEGRGHACSLKTMGPLGSSSTKLLLSLGRSFEDLSVCPELRVSLGCDQFLLSCFLTPCWSWNSIPFCLHSVSHISGIFPLFSGCLPLLCFPLVTNTALLTLTLRPCVLHCQAWSLPPVVPPATLSFLLLTIYLAS